VIKKRKITLCEGGRFLVPRNLRSELGWDLGDTIAISPPEAGVIILRPHTEDAESPNNLYIAISVENGEVEGGAAPPHGAFRPKTEPFFNGIVYSTFDNTGRLTLSKQVMDSLGWSKGDILCVAQIPGNEAATVTLCYKKKNTYVYPGRPFRSILPGDILS